MHEIKPRPPHASFHLQRMEAIHELAGGKADVPHRHAYYTVIWVRAGAGTHLVDFREYPIEKEVVFFISPGQVHQLRPAEHPQGWVITFSPDFLQHHHISEDFIREINLFNSFEQRPPVQLGPEAVEKLSTLLPLMEDTFRSGMPFRIAALSAYLKLFLLYCNQECVLQRPQQDPNDSGHRILRDFKELVTRHFRTLRKTSDYAERLHITPKYLNQVVRSLLGQTAKEVIQEKIVLNAKRELRYSAKSVKEIALELGFEDPLYFSHFFKTCTGQSPTSFRSEA